MTRPQASVLARAGATFAAAFLLTAVPATAQPADSGSHALPEGYVGSDSCIGCHEHEERSRDFHLTVHGKIDSTTWNGAGGCESCHGPGADHVKGKGKTAGMILPGDLSGEEQTALCSNCHDGGGHHYWQGGAHEGRNMSCLTCHAMHPPKGRETVALLSRGNVFDTCTECHLQKKATLVRSSHMPLREGSMTCTSCHAPHGSPGPAQLLQLTVNDNCYSCHAEKRSPMLWEHPPVKENCLTCHDPHGSMHPNLLNARVPRLCQQCHDEARHPTQPYDSAQTQSFFPGSRMFNHGCANCHSQVHGSNHPSGVRFMR